MEDLRRRIDEISSAGIKKGEADELLERRAVLKNAGKLTGLINRAYEAMYGGMTDSGALGQIVDAANALSAASTVAPGLAELAEVLGDLRYNAEDVTERIGDYKKKLDFSPDELEKLEGRLAQIERLERRYGAYEDIQNTLEKAKAELEDMEYLSERLDVLDAQVEKYRAEMIKAASSLTTIRKDAAMRLEKHIADELSGLSMPGVRFTVELTTSEDDFDENGCDSIRFLMSANAGEAVGRIAKIASGGELSRIMLAMKTALSASDSTSILIFDEIDTGVSGVAAQRVGEKLCDLARGKQILCVTHLPQLAVMADQQFSIEKRQSGGRTFTTVSALDLDGRKKELARLIGGENVTKATLNGAGELLNAAREYKERKGYVK